MKTTNIVVETILKGLFLTKSFVKLINFLTCKPTQGFSNSLEKHFKRFQMFYI